MSQDRRELSPLSVSILTNNVGGCQPPSAPSLADQVAELERKRDQLQSLCGQVLATIRVNWDRGTLYACPTDPPTKNKDDEAQHRFEEWLEIYEAQFKELTAASRTVTE